MADEEKITKFAWVAVIVALVTVVLIFAVAIGFLLKLLVWLYT